MSVKDTINRLLRSTLRVELCRVVDPKINGLPVLLTRLSATRLLYMYEIMQHIDKVEGDIVECGVGWGRSLYMVCLCSQIFERRSRIYGFDSFEGFPEPAAEDEPGRFPRIRKGHYRTRKDAVLRYLQNSGINKDFIDNQVSLVSGFFEESMYQYDGRQIAFLHLDVDLYQSYKETLEYFYPKVAAGGIVAFDEYHDVDKYPGAKRAIDEYFAGKPEKIVRSGIVNRFYTVKVA